MHPASRCLHRDLQRRSIVSSMKQGSDTKTAAICPTGLLCSKASRGGVHSRRHSSLASPDFVGVECLLSTITMLTCKVTC